MNRYKRRHDDGDLLEDGQRYRVPMHAMDSMQRAVAQHAIPDASDADRRVARVVALTKQKCGVASTVVTDAFGQHGAAALRRPGARFATDTAALDAVREARKTYEQELCDAWRGDNHKPVLDRKDDDDEDDEGEGGNQEGARAGRKKRTQSRDPSGRESGSSEEWEDRLHREQQERNRATDKAYADYAAELESAHRRK
jgi:hypothetical protein